MKKKKTDYTAIGTFLDTRTERDLIESTPGRTMKLTNKEKAELKLAMYQLARMAENKGKKIIVVDENK